MKSPHWWSNHDSPFTAAGFPSSVSVPLAAMRVRE